MDSGLPCKERCGLEWRWNKISLHMKHTKETKHRAMLLDVWNEFLFAAKSTMTNNQHFWLVGHFVTKMQTSSLMEDGSVRYNSTSKYCPEGRSAANVHEPRILCGMSHSLVRDRLVQCHSSCCVFSLVLMLTILKFRNSRLKFSNSRFNIREVTDCASLGIIMHATLSVSLFPSRDIVTFLLVS